MTLAEKRILSVLRDGPKSPQEIREATKLSPRTISLHLSRMLNKKRVKKYPNLMDMRIQNYYLIEN